MPAVAAGTGTLIVDALPWGEVLEIADAKGVAQALPENRFTPLALSLAPGEYTLRVRPPKGEPRSVTVTVRASGAETSSSWVRTRGRRRVACGSRGSGA
jgi:hypothetical protein